MQTGLNVSSCRSSRCFIARAIRNHPSLTVGEIEDAFATSVREPTHRGNEGWAPPDPPDDLPRVLAHEDGEYRWILNRPTWAYAHEIKGG